MRKSKNRYFYHIFVSPGDALGAITPSVVWMEREFDAYKLSCCMCPSNYYRFWDRDFSVKKSSFYHTPLHSTGCCRNIGTPFGTEKLEWCRYPMVKKFQRYVYSFWRNPRMWQTDGQTDRQTLHDSKDCACIALRGKNEVMRMSPAEGRSMKIKVNGQNLERVKQFCLVTEDCRSCHEVRKRIAFWKEAFNHCKFTSILYHFRVLWGWRMTLKSRLQVI